MATENPYRRQTTRQLVTSAEKEARALLDHFRNTLLPCLYEVQEVSRPVRKRTRFPTMQIVDNALRKLAEASDRADQAEKALNGQLQEIAERVRSDRPGR